MARRPDPRIGAPEDWRSEIVNPGQIPSFIVPEIEDALRRARAAGASGPLEYVGAGMYGIVLCDHFGKAWKVFRILSRPAPPAHRRFLLDSLEDEFDWLTAAAGTDISPHVAVVFAKHPEELVLERECVPGTPGGWSDEPSLSELHSQISEAMAPVGWTAPEFKGSSYIFTPDDMQPVLVDISMPIRIGMNLAQWVDDVLAGRRGTHERWHDLAFYVIRENRMKTIPDDVAGPLIARLNELDPSIKPGFGLKGSRRLVHCEFSCPGESMELNVRPARGETADQACWRELRRKFGDRAERIAECAKFRFREIE